MITNPASAEAAYPLATALQELRHQWKNFPVTHMLIFLEVARNDLGDHGWGVLEIGERLGINQATISRAIIDLSDRTIPPGGSEPIDLVETHPDKYDHRKRIPALTKKGRALFQRIINHINQGRIG